ncbi:MAG: hypothetical protein ACOCZ5_01905 [bacterium]
MKEVFRGFRIGDYLFELEVNEDGTWDVDVFLADNYNESFIKSRKGFSCLENAIEWCEDYIEQEKEKEKFDKFKELNKHNDVCYGDVFDVLVAITDKLVDIEQQLKEVKNELEG